MGAGGCPCRVCLPEATEDENERRCLEIVRQHGWQVMLVPAGDESGEPAFAYTIGLLHQAQHPELVMSGLPLDLMHRVLNELAERVMSGRQFAPGDLVEGALARVALLVEDLTAAGRAETVTWSAWFHRAQVPARQVVWPDTAGRFAWQRGASDLLDERQPPAWRVAVPRVGRLAEEPVWPLLVQPDALAFVCVHVLDDGEEVRFAALDDDPERGSEWSFHCGGDHGGAEQIRLVHIEHVVRAAPSVGALADLAPTWSAWRDRVDDGWTRQPSMN